MTDARTDKDRGRSLTSQHLRGIRILLRSIQRCNSLDLAKDLGTMIEKNLDDAYGVYR